MAKKYTEETYGDHIAEVYDDWYGDYDQVAIDLLCELASGGRALELGIGTGRIALPLAQCGVEVHGIDASPMMVEKLRLKPGGDQISVTFGNFSDVNVQGQFSLIYVVFNTFFALLTQDEQVLCFQNVAKHLGDQGCFLIEAFVPDLKRFDGRQAIRTSEVGESRVIIDVTEMDPTTQQLISQHVVLSEQGVRLYPVQLRYAFPPEIDLMARLAGLKLINRWSSWQKAPFDGNSSKHISVYSK